MPRLIDADALRKYAYASPEDAEGIEYVAWEDIDAAPTIEAVPVVRCSGCWHVRDDRGLLYCKLLRQYRADDDYCSSGIDMRERSDVT